MLYIKWHKTEDITLSFYVMNYYYDERDVCDHITVRVERDDDMDIFAEFNLPAITCTHSYGFKEMELMDFKRFIRNHSPLIWDMTREEMKLVDA